MGTAIVSVILFVLVSLIVKSLCKKYLLAKKSGGCGGSCCGCSGCCIGEAKNKDSCKDC